MVARSLLEVMRMVADTDEDANVVLKAMVKLSEDPGVYLLSLLLCSMPAAAFKTERVLIFLSFYF